MTYFIGETGPDVTMTVQPDCLKHFYVTRKYSDEGGADYGEYQNNVMFISLFYNSFDSIILEIISIYSYEHKEIFN